MDSPLFEQSHRCDAGFCVRNVELIKNDEANRGMAEHIEASAGEALKLTNWFSTVANNNPVE